MQAQDDWISAIPTGWKSLPLKRVASIESSGSYGDEEGVLDRDLPVCTTATVLANGEFNFEKMPIRSFSEKDVERYAVQPKDILVVKSSGSATNIISGKSAQVDEDRYGFVYTNFLMRIRATNIESDYLSHFLKSGLVVERIKRMVSTTTYPNISVPLYSMQAIFFPPIIKQQKIADFLDQETAQIDNLIAKQERLLELLEEKRRATITHVVTRGLNPGVELKETNIPWMPIVPESWSLIKLGYLVKILSGYSPEQAKPKSSGVHPFYKVDSLNSVDDAGCITSAKDYVSDSKLVEQPVFIVFPKRGGAIFTNKVAIVKNSACFDTNLMGLRPVESKLLPEFIYHWIKVRTLGELADTSTLPQINNKHIAPLPIGLPPIDEQREIVNYINTKNMQADKLMQKIQTQITLLRERRTSLISHAVTGKIKV